MTLHFSQIGFTDDLTFTAKASFQTSSFDIISQHNFPLQLKFLILRQKIYLSLQIILPLLKSYGESSIVTLSPGKIRI